MRTTAHAAAFAFAFSLAGCQRQGTADTAQAEETSALVDRAWTRSDSTELPGILRIFLSDGTLVMDSCWETYRLSRWRKESDTLLIWREDTAEIRAEIVSLSAEELVLRLALTGGEEEQRYRPAPVPYVCPDMPR
jgi:hypothetical protein